MISNFEFVEIVKRYFSFLVSHFYYELLNGKHATHSMLYDVSYGGKEKVISISYEFPSDYLQIIIFDLLDGKLSDYDDRKHTHFLSEFNREIYSNITQDAMQKNHLFFSQHIPHSDIERRLIKRAKELRLYMLHSSSTAQRPDA